MPNFGGGPASKGVLRVLSNDELLLEETWSAKALAGVGVEVKEQGTRIYVFHACAHAEHRATTIEATLWQDSTQWRAEFHPERVTPKAKLIFPFKGFGLITQGWINDNGHHNGDDLFALDILGLSESMGPILNGSGSNEAYAGFGRPILCPADGVVVAVQSAIPNQPKPDMIDRKLFTLQDGTEVIQGNHVVIDHGNQEFSGLMHMQPGSITVKVGDRIKQGDQIGKLGNSGNTNGPHLHYQLQDGPNFATASGLPVTFENVASPLTRGTYLRAR
ncbi:MAG: M23 family metallopeptidase [Armatimonadetes bacterium]|nr:M23 family metallopeptidase [Armatimonadota bacterium]